MATTFGERIKQLALSMDVIDKRLLDDFSELIEKYLIKSLNIHNAKIMISDQLDGEIGLMRHSLRGLHSEIAIPLKREDGSLYGQSALAFEKRKPLWIVSAKGKQNLESCENYIDLWSGLKKIPKFKRMGDTDEPVKTRIILPIRIRKNKRVFGAMILESANYLEITQSAKQELKKIEEVISIIVRTHKITAKHQRQSDEAIKNLGSFLSNPMPALTKPNLFLGFSERADKDVTELITNILKEEFSDKVNLVNWKDIDQPGNISQQLVEAINTCRYAICYLSEKEETGEYADNRNVIFEAGMFHGRTEETSAVPTRWVPVREINSHEPPFDFAQERILLVDRNKDGRLKEKAFAKKFRDRVGAMLIPN